MVGDELAPGRRDRTQDAFDVGVEGPEGLGLGTAAGPEDRPTGQGLEAGADDLGGPGHAARVEPDVRVDGGARTVPDRAGVELGPDFEHGHAGPPNVAQGISEAILETEPVEHDEMRSVQASDLASRGLELVGIGPPRHQHLDATVLAHDAADHVAQDRVRCHDEQLTARPGRLGTGGQERGAQPRDQPGSSQPTAGTENESHHERQYGILERVRTSPIPDPASGGELAVVGRAVELAYGSRVALGPSDFEIPSAGVTAVIGPNGSGKSTLLHAVAGLVRPAAGTLRVLGHAPTDVHRRVAYVLQTTRVNELIPVTVREVVVMGRYARRGALARLSRDDRRAVDEAMERLAVADLASRHLRELSGGQRQRVFVAQGLAQEADVLLLDEPITGLDLVSHERIDEVVEEQAAAGTTVVMTTHDVAEAGRAAHVLLLAGRVVAQGPPATVLTHEQLGAAYGAALAHVDPSGFAPGAFALDDSQHGPHAPRPRSAPRRRPDPPSH